MARVNGRKPEPRRPQPRRRDARIVYGAQCVWWDSIHHAGRGAAIPVCPECGSPLFEVESESAWWASVALFESGEADGIKKKGYRDFLEWLRGKCFPGPTAALLAWGEETGRTIPGLTETIENKEETDGQADAH